MDDISEQDWLLPRIVDIRAKVTPNKTFAFIPNGQTLEDGFSPLTYAMLAKATNAMAWWLDNILGGQVTGDSFPTVPYIGANDVRYSLLTFACIKTHRKFMVPLITNTPEAQVRLLKVENCSLVLASKDNVHAWDPARKAIDGLCLIEVPELSHFINDAPVEHYPYNKTYQEALFDPAWTIQTSGTTGNPQPLNCNSKSVIMAMSDPRKEDLSLAMPSLLRKSHCINFLPISWGVGLIAVTTWPLTAETTTIVLPASMPQPMTPEYAIKAIKKAPRGSSNGGIFVPDVLRKLAQNQQLLEDMKLFDWIGYAGAPLDFPTGDKIAQYTRVQSYMGSTDSGGYPLLLNNASDWKYHRFHPTFLSFRFEHFQDDLYELCIERQVDDPRPCFTRDPSCQVYHTKDLWSKVPGREDEGFWTTAGRIDDFVKLTSMTKFNAIQIEQIIDSHPLIEKSLVAGDGRANSFAIVQLNLVDPTTSSKEELVKELWPVFERANAVVLDDARLKPELVLIADPSMPLKRTAKGTVDRRNTIKMYQQAVDDMYEKAGKE